MIPCRTGYVIISRLSATRATQQVSFCLREMVLHPQDQVIKSNTKLFRQLIVVTMQSTEEM